MHFLVQISILLPLFMLYGCSNENAHYKHDEDSADYDDSRDYDDINGEDLYDFNTEIKDESEIDVYEMFDDYNEEYTTDGFDPPELIEFDEKDDSFYDNDNVITDELPDINKDDELVDVQELIEIEIWEWDSFVQLPCNPGHRCIDNIDILCSEDGANLTLVTCPKKLSVCIDGFGCKQKRCFPGELICDNEILKQCKNDSYSTETLQDCNETGLHCNPFSGSCSVEICNPNSKKCKFDAQNKAYFICNSSGTAYMTGNCQPYFCDSQTNECDENICNPGDKWCISESLMMQCQSDGTGKIVDCLAENKFCNYLDSTNEQCIPWRCIPNKYSCNENYAIYCSPVGDEYMDFIDCTALGKVCRETSLPEEPGGCR